MRNLLRSSRCAVVLVGCLMIARNVQGTPILEVEANNTLATAQNIDAYFSLDFSPDIGDTSTNTSTTIPHVTVHGTGNGTVDWYSFTASAGVRGIFDIDYGIYNDPSQADFQFDPWIELRSSGPAAPLFNDDAPIAWGQGGSFHHYDSYLEYTFATAGTYYLGVGSCCGVGPLNPVPAGSDYQLQVSIGDHSVDQVAAVPEPASLLLLGTGLAAIARRRFRSRS